MKMNALISPTLDPETLDITYRYKYSLDNGKTWHDVPSDGTINVKSEKVTISEKSIFNMTQEQLKKAIGKNVIVSERWGFGLKFYQANLEGVEFHYYGTKEEIHLHLRVLPKIQSLLSQETFDLRPNNRMIYLPS